MIRLLLALIASVGVTAVQAQEAASALYRFETTYQSAGNYSGSIFGASADVRVGSETILLPRAQRFTRAFEQGATFTETSMGLGLSQKLSTRTYLMSDVFYTPNAQILAKWSANLDPHIAIGNGDFGFRVGANSYNDLDAAILAPSYLHAFTDDFMVSQTVTAVRSDRWSVASSTQLIAKPLRNVMIRVVPAFGETLEAAGLAAQFQSLSIEASLEILKRVRIGIGGTNYHSTLRDEKSVLFRIEAS